MVQNTTIEERVALLELQVTNLNAGVTNQKTDLGSVEEEVTVISAEQIFQDGRILELEIDSDGKVCFEILTKRFHTIRRNHLSSFSALNECD